MCGGCWSSASVSGPTCSLYPNPVAQAYGKDFGIERIKLTKDIQLVLLEYCQSVDLDGIYVQDGSDDLSKRKDRRSLPTSSSGTKENENSQDLRSSQEAISRYDSCTLRKRRSGALRDESAIQKDPQPIFQDTPDYAAAGSPPSEFSEDQQVVRPTDISVVSSPPSPMRIIGYTQDYKVDPQTPIHEEDIRA